MGFGKLGQKSLAIARLGAKSIHTGSKIGSKYVVPAASLASIALMAAAPEIALPLGAAAGAAKPILNNIEKITR
jgi:hypothetical protein